MHGQLQLLQWSVDLRGRRFLSQPNDLVKGLDGPERQMLSLCETSCGQSIRNEGQPD